MQIGLIIINFKQLKCLPLNGGVALGWQQSAAVPEFRVHNPKPIQLVKQAAATTTTTTAEQITTLSIGRNLHSPFPSPKFPSSQFPVRSNRKTTQRRLININTNGWGYQEEDSRSTSGGAEKAPKYVDNYL